MTSNPLLGGTFTMAEDLTVTRMGYGAMQLAGPGVFGPPKDREAAIAVLREVVDLGITHIDTADFYGPHVTNELIREALAPYPGELHIVIKVGSGSALTLLNTMVTPDTVDYLSKVEAEDMQLFDTAMTEGGVNADSATARGLAGAHRLPALIRRLDGRHELVHRKRGRLRP